MAKVRPDVLAAVRAALLEWEWEVTESGLKPSSKTTYIDYAREFVRWLDDDFTPGANVARRRRYVQ